MKPFLILFLCTFFTIPFAQAKRGIEEALFTWTDSPSSTLNVIWLVEEDEPTRFVWGKEGEKIERTAEIYRQSFYEKAISFWGIASDVKNARFSLPSLKDAEVEACRVQLTGLSPDTVYWVKLGEKRI